MDERHEVRQTVGTFLSIVLIEVLITVSELLDTTFTKFHPLNKPILTVL